MNIVVKNVAGFDLYVKNSTAGRTFTVKIGDGVAETITHPGSQTIDGSLTDVIPFTFNTGTTDQTTIQILGDASGTVSGSVYPGYIVVYSTAQTIPVESVTITGAPTAAVLLATETVQLGATVAPDRSNAKTLTWTSGDESVATVDSTGKVEYKAAGTVKITATAESGVKDEVEITIQAAVVNVTGIAVKDSSDATSGTVNAGDSITLTATVSPDDASNKAVTWTSSNEEAATVADGVVKAVGAGTATITATAADGSNVAGSYVVTVQAVSTVAYHKYTATGKGVATATMSDDTVLKGSDITVTDNKAESAIVVGSVKSGVKGTNTTLDFGAEYTTAKTSWVNGDAIQTYEFTITAVNACTIEKIESSMVTGSSGSVSWAIYLDDTTTASATVTGKDGVLSVADLNKSLSANDTLKVKIVATATGDIGSASSTKAFKITCGPIVVTAK